MSDEMQVAVVGASGRMGQMCGVTDAPGSDWVGRDLGEAMGGAARGMLVSGDPLEVFARAQAILDFTVPAATVKHAGLAAQARAVHVIGTTGMEAG